MPTSQLDIRPPAVAGTFYAESREQLTKDLEQLLLGAQPAATDAPLPKALIAPHASRKRGELWLFYSEQPLSH